MSDGMVVLDTRTGERGDAAAWVEQFKHVWSAPRERLDRLLALMSEDVVLKAPTTPPVTRGREAGKRAFERALRAMPDLCAEVSRWSASGNALFIEMRFRATIGGRAAEWSNVDRFIFNRGEAIERVAYFNPAQVRKHFVRNPLGLWQLLRLRLGM
jgi:ketosteroid isomerase-like protein